MGKNQDWGRQLVSIITAFGGILLPEFHDPFLFLIYTIASG